MTIICASCGHDNQGDALYCDECGEELVSSNSSTEEEDISLEESFTEGSSNEEEIVSDIETPVEMSVDVIASEEAESEFATPLETTDSYPPEETEETEPESSALPIGAATRLEIDEPPIAKIVSPPTTLELPELPTAVLIDRESGEKFILPSQEKVVYIGRVNDEFPVQVDLSTIPNADLISRVHAAIHWENETYYLEDAGSANGTWLNEKLIKTGTRFRQQLNPGDTIAMGRNQSVELTFDLED